VLSGCANSGVMPLSEDTVQITTSAAPICGAAGAQQVAVRRAAIETLQRGYDRFIIMGAGYQNQVGVVGYTPVQAQTTGVATGNVFSAQTTYSGGYPIVAGHHVEGLVVKMFHEGDPGAAKAVSARATLGPDWRQLMQQGTRTTCG
jgi:hypothetical protein